MVRTKQPTGRYKKRAAASDDSDAEPPSKKARGAASATAVAGPPKTRTDGDGNKYWELNQTGNRRVAVSEFKGRIYLTIREYYEKDGEMLPGKKGIMLAPDQFSVIVSALPQIEAALGKKGVQVPRPEYGEAAPAAEEETEEEEEDEAEETEESEEEKPAKKSKSKKKEDLEEEEDEDD